MASATGDRPAGSPGRSGGSGAGADRHGTARATRHTAAPAATPATGPPTATPAAPPATPRTPGAPAAAAAPTDPPAPVVAPGATVDPAAASTPAGLPASAPSAGGASLGGTPGAEAAGGGEGGGGGEGEVARSGRIGRPRGPRRSRDERRAELLDAAERAIRRIGPQASMDELAAEAGITKPILYSHFGDKAGLAAALTERVATELDKALTASLSKVQHPEQVLFSTVDAFCSFIESETELYHFLWYATKSQSQADRSGSKVLISGFADQISFALGSALRQVGADSGAAEPWSYAIIGMTLTAGEWWLERRTMTREDLVTYLSQLLWGGLAGAGLDRLAELFDAEEAPAPFRPTPAVVDLDARRDA